MLLPLGFKEASVFYWLTPPYPQVASNVSVLTTSFFSHPSVDKKRDALTEVEDEMKCWMI